MNQLFDGAFDDIWDRGGQRTRTWAPPVEIYENEGELVFVAELPGFKRGEIEISVENGQLSLAGERRFEEQGSRNYHRNERWYGRFERAFQLPVSVDPEKIAANLKNGLLVISVPKREEAKPRQIEVKVG
jgi:HSP20 family protein